MNFLYLRKYYSESLGQAALLVQRMENGVRTQYDRTAVGDDPPVSAVIYTREALLAGMEL